MSGDWEYSDSCCKKCGESLRRADCWQCFGEGGFDGEDLMELDPLWYDEDSYETCSECGGVGYFEWCPCAEKEVSV